MRLGNLLARYIYAQPIEVMIVADHAEKVGPSAIRSVKADGTPDNATATTTATAPIVIPASDITNASDTANLSSDITDVSNRARAKVLTLPTSILEWPEQWLERYEERAAIREFCGNSTRSHAQADAELELRRDFHDSTTGLDRPTTIPYLECGKNIPGVN